MIATKRLWLTADKKKVVEEGHKNAAFLLCAKGQEVPKAVVEQYGLAKIFSEKKKEQSENKMVEPVKNKGKGKEKDKKSGLTIKKGD